MHAVASWTLFDGDRNRLGRQDPCIEGSWRALLQYLSSCHPSIPTCLKSCMYLTARRSPTRDTRKFKRCAQFLGVCSHYKLFPPLPQLFHLYRLFHPPFFSLFDIGHQLVSLPRLLDCRDKKFSLPTRAYASWLFRCRPHSSSPLASRLVIAATAPTIGVSLSLVQTTNPRCNIASHRNLLVPSIYVACEDACPWLTCGRPRGLDWLRANCLRRAASCKKARGSTLSVRGELFTRIIPWTTSRRQEKRGTAIVSDQDSHYVGREWGSIFRTPPKHEPISTVSLLGPIPIRLSG
ncbi:hypothetical protein F4775DRAFT_333501 [Biscogniauxia sp. FL1348]|nr:hypothetical protein F4775DRAFT_333501 [Biscogniauxia sp. FL1348]